MFSSLSRGLFWKLIAAFLAVIVLSLAGAGAPMAGGALWLPLLIATLLSWLLARSVGRPIQRMTDVAQRMAQGELSARTPSQVSRQIGSLGDTMNLMAEQLQQRVQELESQQTQAQAILESMVEGVLALDGDARVLWLNASARRLFGVSADEAEGKRLLELFRQPEMEGLIREALASRRPVVREVQAFGPTAEVIQFQVTPCRSGERGAALVLVAQDVTEMRRLEGMRREFVANVSHELKTPLTSIKGLVETLLHGALEDPANNRRFVSLIDADAARLGRLIDDLLELSQIESKAVPLVLQPVALRPFFEGLLPLFAHPLRERHITLDLAVPADAPAVKGDPERLRQVFVNLLDNAVKFNRTGGRVKVSASAAGAAVQVAVTDTGAGIPEADLPRIFERFYRVDKARSRALGGTGLGLSIVKHLAELHHGSVEVRSRVGEGSTFIVTLPAWPASSQIGR